MSPTRYDVIAVAVLAIATVPFDSKLILGFLVIALAAWSVVLFMLTSRVPKPKVWPATTVTAAPVPTATSNVAAPIIIQIVGPKDPPDSPGPAVPPTPPLSPLPLAPSQTEEINEADMKILPFAEQKLVSLLAGAGKVLPEVLVAAMAAKGHSPQDLIKQAATVLIAKYPEELQAYDGAAEGLAEHIVKQAGGPSAAVGIANDILLAEHFGIEPGPLAEKAETPADLVPVAATPMVPYDQAAEPAEAAPAPVVEPAVITPVPVENAP